jgi:aerobic carbon-monoxide dehydrogenase medium subunit
MKSPDFDYIRVQTLDEALALLVEHGDDARILAGGQTLLATLNMRLSEPRLLIDLQALTALRGIRLEAGRVVIGALTTHTDIESSALIAEHAPLLSQAVGHIAHRAIRNSGTWGGSLVYGDPAAEWPCCLMALDGVVTLQGPQGQRRVAATDFFQDLYTTDLQPDEILVSADFPAASAADWYGFDELARRHGDYAVAGLAVVARFQGTTLERINLCFLGLGSTPIRATQTESLLQNSVLTIDTINAGMACLRAELEPVGDLTHGPESKLHLATVLAKRLWAAAHASRHASLGTLPT